MSYVFPGFPPFLQEAASRLDLADEPSTSSRPSALLTAASLCAQASRAEGPRAESILESAAILASDLRTAVLAVELMIADVRAGRGLSAPSLPPDSLPPMSSAEKPASPTSREHYGSIKPVCDGRRRDPKSSR